MPRPPRFTVLEERRRDESSSLADPGTSGVGPGGIGLPFPFPVICKPIEACGEW